MSKQRNAHVHIKTLKYLVKRYNSEFSKKTAKKGQKRGPKKGTKKGDQKRGPKKGTDLFFLEKNKSVPFSPYI